MSMSVSRSRVKCWSRLVLVWWRIEERWRNEGGRGRWGAGLSLRSQTWEERRRRRRLWRRRRKRRRNEGKRKKGVEAAISWFPLRGREAGEVGWWRGRETGEVRWWSG